MFQNGWRIHHWYKSEFELTFIHLSFDPAHGGRAYDINLYIKSYWNQAMEVEVILKTNSVHCIWHTLN